MTYLTIIAAAMIAMTAAARADTRIVMEEVMVPSSDPGIEIYVRNKRPRRLFGRQSARATDRPGLLSLFRAGVQ